MSKYYIARDKDNTVRMFNNKPTKRRWNFWQSDNTISCRLRESWFPEVKWEDEEPKVLTIEESPWIKFTDKHPNIGDNIIIMYKNSVMDKICYYPIIFNGWDGICIKQFDGYEAIAWMPIPKYKE